MGVADLIITEGISGMWHYHLSREDNFTRGLCGAWVMRTAIPREGWMRATHGDHMPKRMTWCKTCEEKRNG